MKPKVNGFRPHAGFIGFQFYKHYKGQLINMIELITKCLEQLLLGLIFGFISAFSFCAYITLAKQKIEINLNNITFKVNADLKVEDNAA